MRNELTDLTVVMDRSGSMAVCQKDAEEGLNAFIDNQKKVPGQCTFSLVQFDTDYEFVYRGKPIKDVLRVALVPRGNTALLDAVGRAIIETGERLKHTEESQRPGLVVFVILTDGLENYSKEFTKAKIKEMIEHQQSVYKWQFTYLGANQDAFAEAQAMGIPAAASARYSQEKTSGAIKMAGVVLTSARKGLASGQSVQVAYTDQQRNEVK